MNKEEIQENLNTLKGRDENTESIISSLRGKLLPCFSEEPLKLWERNGEFADIKLRK